jgi:hypothetical protein
MESSVLYRIMGVLDSLEAGGYEDFMNYSVVRHLLHNPQSALAALYTEALNQRPDMDIVNLVCSINGALNFTISFVVGDDEAPSIIDDTQRFNEFIGVYKSRILGCLLARNNNPTIPQRAFPVSCYLPFEISNIGLLELGCSRGDIGLLLLNLSKVLDSPLRYLFPNFILSVPQERLNRSRPIARYFGVDLDINVDDPWLLSLWGLRDRRREQLRNFYEDFKPDETTQFRRIQADACIPSGYLDYALKFLEGTDLLVVLTSFMIYQLSFNARYTLAKTIQVVENKLLKATHGITSMIWLNQGLDPRVLLTGEFDFTHCYLGKLWFEGKTLYGLPLARLFNDACEGWDELELEPVVIGQMDGNSILNPS